MYQRKHPRAGCVLEWDRGSSRMNPVGKMDTIWVGGWLLELGARGERVPQELSCWDVYTEVRSKLGIGEPWG